MLFLNMDTLINARLDFTGLFKAVFNSINMVASCVKAIKALVIAFTRTSD
jgi:hypothetical protein